MMKQMPTSILLALLVLSAAGGAHGTGAQRDAPCSRKLQQTSQGTTTILFTLQVPATSALESQISLQQQCITQLSTAAAQYFQVSPDQVSAWFNGKQQRLQPGTTVRQYVAQIQPTWLDGDTSIPAYLKQQLQALQDNPSAILPQSMVQTYAIVASGVTLVGPVSVTPPLPDKGSGSGSGSSSSKTAGIAAGVTVGAVALLTAALIAMYWLKHRTNTGTPLFKPSVTQSKASTATPHQSKVNSSAAHHHSPAGATPTVGPMDVTSRAPSQLGPLFTHLYQQGHVTITMAAATTCATSGAPPSGSDDQPPSQGSASSASTQPVTATEAQPNSVVCSSSQGFGLDGLRIPWASIKLGGVLGAGGQGQVFKGLWQHNKVAVKQLNFGSCDPGRLRVLYQEARIMRDLHHPCIARVYGVVDEAPHHAVVMQYYRRGTLSKFMSSPTYPSDIQSRLRMAIQVASGMSFMHGKGVLHGDLKASNLLLDDDHNIPRVVISDFGLAASFDANSNTAGEAQGTSQTCGGALTVTICPPEVLLNPCDMRVRSAAADVYAFGIVLWELMSGCQAYRGMKAASVKALVCSGRRPAIPSFVPVAVASIIDGCWAQNAADRPSFDQVLNRLTAAQQDLEQEEPNGLTATQTMTVIY